MTHSGATAVASVWRDQRQCSHAANRFKNRIVFWPSTALALAILGAVLATVATQIGLKTVAGRYLAAAAGAIVLAAAPVIRPSRVSKGDIEAWPRSPLTSQARGMSMWSFRISPPLASCVSSSGTGAMAPTPARRPRPSAFMIVKMSSLVRTGAGWPCGAAARTTRPRYRGVDFPAASGYLARSRGGDGRVVLL